MRDRLCVDVMGTPVEVDLANLAASDALRVREVLRPYVRDRTGNAPEALIEVGPGPGDDAVVRTARELGWAVMSRRPDLWWLRIAGTLTTPAGDVVLFCESPAGVSVSGSDADVVPARRDGLVGIDREGGTDPILCHAGDFSWVEETEDAPDRKNRVSRRRVVRIAVWGPRTADAGEVENLADGEAIELLVGATVGAEALHRPLTLVQSVLDATGGAVRIRSADPDAVRSLLVRAASRDGARGTGSTAHRDSHRVVPAESSDASPRLYRGRVLDAIDLPGAELALTVVGSGEAVRVLEPSSAGIWRVADGVPMGDILDATTAGRGSATAATTREAVEATVAALVADRVLTHEPTWAVDPNAVWRSSAHHTYVLSADRDEPPLSLRDSAHHIWQTLVEERACSVRHLAEAASAHYGVVVADIEDEIGRLVDDFRARGLVARV